MGIKVAQMCMHAFFFVGFSQALYNVPMFLMQLTGVSAGLCGNFFYREMLHPTVRLNWADNKVFKVWRSVSQRASLPYSG